MKGDGRQHGLFRCRKILPSPGNSRPSPMIVNGFHSPPTAKFYGKVRPLNPMNPSKIVGNCGRPRCVEGRSLPVCKSKEKAKGTQKLKSSEDMANQRSVAWRIVNNGVGQNYNGVSATGLLNNLSGCYRHDMDDGIGDDDRVAGDVNEERPFYADRTAAWSVDLEEMVRIVPIKIKVKDKNKDKYKDEDKEKDDDGGGGKDDAHDDNDDDDDDFFVVLHVVDTMDDDGDWCLVEEI